MAEYLYLKLKDEKHRAVGDEQGQGREQSSNEKKETPSNYLW